MASQLLSDAAKALGVLGKGYVDKQVQKRESDQALEKLRQNLRQSAFRDASKILQSPDKYTPESIQQAQSIVDSFSQEVGTQPFIPQERPLSPEEQQQQLFEQLSGKVQERYGEQIGVLNPLPEKPLSQKELADLELVNLRRQRLKQQIQSDASNNTQNGKSDSKNDPGAKLAEVNKRIAELYKEPESKENQAVLDALIFQRSLLTKEIDTSTGRNIPIGVRSPELIPQENFLPDPIQAALQGVTQNPSALKNRSTQRLDLVGSYVQDRLNAARQNNINLTQAAQQIDKELQEQFGMTLQEYNQLRKNAGSN